MAGESKSDKLLHHGYHRFYPWFLAHFKGEEINLLEIGIDRTESLELWKEYFGRVNLHGIDIDKKSFSDEEVTLHQVDQSNEAELDGFVMDVGVKFDVVIDDGSHVPSHQMLTINKLWSLVKPGGIYIIEDIETSYWKRCDIYGYKFNAKKSGIMRCFFDVSESINSEFHGRPTRNRLIRSFAGEVEMVTFAQNAIILVKKDSQAFGQFYAREYRFKERVKLSQRSIQRLPQRIFRKIRGLVR